MDPHKFRRQVFFCHGFDRRGPRFFHLWQKREARRYVARFGGDGRVGERDGDTWSIRSDDAETNFTFCDWSDLVSERFGQSVLGLSMDAFRIGWTALRQGFFGKVMRRDWSLGLWLLWGFLPFLLSLILSVILLISKPLLILLMPAIFPLLHWLALRFDGRLGMGYIMHIAWAARRMALRDDARIENFVARYAARIEAAGPADEVLIVGHSIGAALAVRLAAAVDRPVTVLTLGQSIPLVSLQKEAEYIRRDMAGLAGWIDVSARKDMLGFLAFDPSDGRAACMTVNLKRAFGERTVKTLKWKGFAMHFLFFNANLRAAPWDWIGILTQPVTLQKRFEGARRRDGRGERLLLF